MRKFFESLTKEQAGQIIDLALGRLEANEGRMGAAILEVMEIDRPVNMTAEEWEVHFWEAACTSLAKSYDEPT